ncbi:MAG TPA: ricin-type beta-trefoil lectin domain protein [Terriglobales bacterium]|nr:ricin-type beta-trefoil lectin domain protein [Terriglobales bacterium]
MPILRLSKLPTLIAAATIATATGLTAAPSAHAQNFLVNLVSIQNSKCLQPLTGPSAAGQAIVQVTCNGSVAQQWTSAVHGLANGWALSFTNAASGMCLDARGTSAPGTPIQQWPCAPGKGISNQFWSYSANGNELVSEVNPSPNKYCLATSGNSDGTPMELQLCNGNNPQQQWNHPLAAPVASTPVSAPVTSSPGNLYVALPTEMPIIPNPKSIESELLWVGDWLKPGEIRRVTDQLELSVPGSQEPQVNNRIRCFDEGLVIQPGASSGTNYPSGSQNYQWNGSTLLVAPNPLPPDDSGVSPPQAFFNCQILVYTIGQDGDTRYQMSALPPPLGQTAIGTWLQMSSSNQTAALIQVFPNPPCPPDDNTPKVHVCIYLDQQSPVFVIPVTPNHPSFTAGNGVTAIDGEATMEVTTCDNGTDSCKGSAYGNDNGSAGQAFLEFQQLNPDGSLCQVNRAYSEIDGKPVEQFGVNNAQHHLPIYWHISAPVSQLCNGSRAFSADLHMQYINGNPIKIEGGNINVINSATAQTTRVPGVIGLTEQQARAAVVAAGLYLAPAAYVRGAALQGTVLAQNSPAGTIEPVGSPVQITVSVGQTTNGSR